MTAENLAIVFAPNVLRSQEETLEQVRAVIEGIDPVHVAAIRCLFTFLHEVSTRIDENRMTAENLATVFAPNLFNFFFNGQ
ncbi:hypothetical protein T484DRAFT_1780788 [Baffinella frigidus]|nr:hypothetical protein T484DRAFT_1780788 [Cryptophyta sp. CCMP2293]